MTRQCLEADLIDELRIDLVPIFLASDTPFAGELANAPIVLDDPAIIPDLRVTHLHYHVRRL
ncbi:hypothetical protein [Nocardia brevicatena]|uniref:hypothetical protein n=1 Tax=Nocardia brevicatena TaxID=37327 RepID=UPI0002E7C605|nr:hypothetical protein [Nocardia brevicatena]